MAIVGLAAAVAAALAIALLVVGVLAPTRRLPSDALKSLTVYTGAATPAGSAEATPPPRRTSGLGKLGRYVIPAAAALALVLILSRSIVLALAVAAVAGLSVPRLYDWQRRRRRRQQFDDQLEGTFTLVASALKAGYSLYQGLEAAARELPPPMAEELGQVLREVGMGVSPDLALTDFAARMSNPDLDLAVTAVVIQRRTGGNLAEILERVSQTIRERHRLRREVGTLTAQVRMSGVMVGLLPVALGVLMSVLNPYYMSPLTNTNLGRLLIGVIVVMELVGFFIIQRIVNIEV